jgi:hypothetical protein
LVKVDDAGGARSVRWEALANLVPTKRPGTSVHPARQNAARAEAMVLGERTLEEHRAVRADWFLQARKDLTSLPITLTQDMPREERIRLRHRLQAQTAERLTDLEKLARVELTEPKLVGRLRVLPAAAPQSEASADSEWVAMLYVERYLTADGWDVADVHTEGRGYDLEARRYSQVRAIEIKGVAGSASSSGIRMSGNEVLIATQYRKDYWLYVVDGCEDGVGRLFGAYEDPATLFGTDMVGDAVFRVPGSSLNRAPGRNA